MKKQLLTGIIALGAAAGADAAQAWVTFDNSNGDPAATPSSTNFGLIFICGASSIIPLNQDINLVLLGGPNAGSLSQIAALTFATGTAQTDWSFLQIPGQFADPKGLIYTVPGVAPGGTAFLEVEAWLGPDATYAEAVNDAAVGNSGVFQNATGGGGSPPGAPIDSGDGMPSFTVGECPEPTTFAFAGLSTAALLLFRRKK
jgi:hypothetical protein